VSVDVVDGDLDHWFDETLSHWLWHIAWAALFPLRAVHGPRLLTTPATLRR
jgi:hypothetical protein